MRQNYPTLMRGHGATRTTSSENRIRYDAGYSASRAKRLQPQFQGPVSSGAFDRARVGSITVQTEERAKTLIDRIRHDIQERLDQLLGEAEKLRRALVALGSRAGAPPPSQTASKPTRAKAQRATRSTRASSSQSPTNATTQPVPPTAKRPKASRSTQTPTTPARTAPGATKNAVLAALSKSEALTAGDVAAATGLGRATVSTTLSKLAKTGEVSKAARGYQLTQAGSAASPARDAQPQTAEPDQSEPT